MDDRRNALPSVSHELFLTAFRLRNLEPWVMDRLTTLLEEQSIRAGDVLYSAGAPAGAVYFMQQGRVRTTRQGGPSWTFNGNWLLGGFDVFLDGFRSHTAVALDDFEALRLRADSWLDLVADSFDLTRRVVDYSAGAVAGLEDRLALRVAEASRPHVLPDRALDAVERLAALTEFTFLRGAGVQVLAELASAAQEVWLEPGESLDPSPGVRMSLILHGEIEALRKETCVRRRFGPSQTLLGVAAFAPPGTAQWEARVVLRTRLLSIPMEAWLDAMEEHFDLVRTHMSALARRRESLLDRLAEQSAPEEVVLTEDIGIVEE